MQKLAPATLALLCLALPAARGQDQPQGPQGPQGPLVEEVLVPEEAFEQVLKRHPGGVIVGQDELQALLEKAGLKPAPTAKPEAPPPEDLEGLLDNLRRGYPARSIVVTIEAPEEDFTLRGAVIADLPVSIADTLRPGATSRRGDPYKRNLRLAVPTPGVVVGKQSLQVRVRDLVPR